MEHSRSFRKPAPFPSGIGRYRTRRGVPAWLLSLATHAMALTALFLLTQNFPRGVSELKEHPGGIVLVHATSEPTEYLSENTLAQNSSASPSSVRPALPTQGPPLEVSEGDQQTADRTIDGLEGLADIAAHESFSEALTPRRNDPGGQITTEVFGVQGTGNEFIYLFDCSASMEGFDARPLKAAKQQLMASLKSLESNHRFQLIFYNHGTRAFTPGAGRATMVFAEEKVKQQAFRFIESIRGAGGTDHLQALKFALQFSPDVIFLLTDAEGGFTTAELSLIADWNRGNAVIHAIEFGDGPKLANQDRSLERLAQEHRGQYLYKDIQTLESRKP